MQGTRRLNLDQESEGSSLDRQSCGHTRQFSGEVPEVFAHCASLVHALVWVIEPSIVHLSELSFVGHLTRIRDVA